jgi:hypothetical protein
MFGPLKDDLRRRRFSDDELKEAVHDRLAVHSNKRLFFFCGIRKVMVWWVRCVEKHGEYGDKR